MKRVGGLAAALLAVWVVGAHADRGLTRVATIPLRVDDNRFPLDVKIDGKPATLQFDTGTVMTTLSYKGLRRLGLQAVGQFGLAP